jgi:hypothetical protein
MRSPRLEQGIFNIREDLAKYKAKQPPLSKYDEVLSKKKKEVIIS